MNIRQQVQGALSCHDDYILNTNKQLLQQIADFGCGETEFHTADLERLIKENDQMREFILRSRHALSVLECVLDHIDLNAGSKVAKKLLQETVTITEKPLEY